MIDEFIRPALLQVIIPFGFILFLILLCICSCQVKSIKDAIKKAKDDVNQHTTMEGTSTRNAVADLGTMAGHLGTMADNNARRLDAVLNVVNPGGSLIQQASGAAGLPAQQPAYDFPPVPFRCLYCVEENGEKKPFTSSYLLDQHKKSQGCMVKQMEFFLDNPAVSGDPLNDRTELVRFLQGNPNHNVVSKKWELTSKFLKKFG